MAKKYRFLEDLPERFEASFGKLAVPFVAIMWGNSGQGKTNLLMQILRILCKYGKVLYVSLEEGHEATLQATVARQLADVPEIHGQVLFADSSMKYEVLCERLRKRKSPRFIIIDSLQYWDISPEQYVALKEEFRTKSFMFISHATGKEPKGPVAIRIRYDAPLKIHVDGFVAFIVSRFGGNAPYIIWEEGAKRYWGKKYKSVTKGAIAPPKPATT
jgi:pantothenate kinase-related protein Tda10